MESTLPQMTAAESAACLEALAQIERGEATIPEEERKFAEADYSGIPVFHASNGWTFWVFNDCDEWDYLHAAKAPDGRSWGFHELSEQVQEYQPPVETASRIWGIEP